MKKVSRLEFDLEPLVARLGFAAMSAAAMLSLVELEHFRAQKVEVMQPAFATVSATPVDANKGDEMIRREKEESPHSIVSYGTTMRSHATAGRR
jgi:hypothetical protein